MVVIRVPSTRWQSKPLHTHTKQAPQHHVAEPVLFIILEC